MKRKLLIILPFVLFWSCNHSSSESVNSDIREEKTPSGLVQFVSFDQAYIPTLFFTSVEDLDASRASFLTLQKEWNTFRSEGSDIFEDPKWDNGLENIDQHIKSAESFIASGLNLKEAHEELEHVREILLILRQRNNFEYFIDHLTAFHEPMEEIVLIAKRTMPDQWTIKTTIKIQSVLPEAEARWQAVLESAFDPAHYEFNAQQYQKLNDFLDAESQALNNLKNNIDQKVSTPILRQSALNIKKHFAETFKLFGKLEPYLDVRPEDSEQLY